MLLESKLTQTLLWFKIKVDHLSLRINNLKLNEILKTNKFILKHLNTSEIISRKIQNKTKQVQIQLLAINGLGNEVCLIITNPISLT